jgi:hypothetical protein
MGIEAVRGTTKLTQKNKAEAFNAYTRDNRATRRTQIQRHQKGKMKITTTRGKNNFSIEISTDLL